MKLYRQAMPPALPSGDALQETLPRLTPEETGPAPTAVNASAVSVGGAASKTTYTNFRKQSDAPAARRAERKLAPGETRGY